MPTGFHTNTNLLTRSRQSTIELLRFLRMLQSLFLELSRLGVNPGDLLKLGGGNLLL
jgi:hypothetical protein